MVPVHLLLTVLEQEKNKAAAHMLSTKMEICTQRYGKTWYVCLRRDKHLI